MAVAWIEDDLRDLPVIESNLLKLLDQISREAPSRILPRVAAAQEWHRRIYEGTQVPVPYYAGEIRDSDPQYPELYGYEVMVGGQAGVPSYRVPEELRGFEESIQRAVSILDPLISPGREPAQRNLVNSVLTLCAYAHGEWVRIHPFANGNGRTARLWANWCALRYGLPPFVRLKPRPESRGYAIAAAASMKNEHRLMVAEFADMLELQLGSEREDLVRD